MKLIKIDLETSQYVRCAQVGTVERDFDFFVGKEGLGGKIILYFREKKYFLNYINRVRRILFFPNPALCTRSVTF